MSIEKSVVLKRLQFIGNNLKQLRRFESMSLEDYIDYVNLFNSVQIALIYYPLYIQQVAEYISKES